jgi:hypothetical protein
VLINIERLETRLGSIRVTGSEGLKYSKKSCYFLRRLIFFAN